jgi:hypothetical protein
MTESLLQQVMEPSQWLMEHAVKNLFGESVGCVRQPLRRGNTASAKSNGRPIMSAKLQHGAIMTVAVLIAGSGLMLHMGHAQQSGTKRDLQSFR